MSNFILAKSQKVKTVVIDIDQIKYVETGELKETDPFFSYGEFVLWVHFFEGDNGYIVEYFDSAEARTQRIGFLTSVDCK